MSAENAAGEEKLALIEEDPEASARDLGMASLFMEALRNGADKSAEDDTEQAVIVIVFRLAEKPTEKPTPGMIQEVQLNETKTNCREDFKQIFKFYGEEEEKEGLGEIEDEMTWKKYNEKVREKFSKVIQEVGFDMSCKASVDQDEYFVRIKAGDERLEQIAENTLYAMPFTQAAYKYAFEDQHIVKPFNPEDFKNHSDEFVPSYEHFDGSVNSDHPDFWQKFGTIDKIRLMMNRIQLKMNIEALKRQDIISHYFFADDPEELRKLGQTWSLKEVFTTYTGNSDDVRLYFGEEIAYYYLFLGVYLKALLFPVSLAVLLVPAEYLYERYHGDFYVINTAKIVYGMFIIGWVLGLQKTFSRRINRANQAWGMYAYDDTIEPNLYTYVEDTTNTAKNCITSVAPFVAPAYCIIFFYAEKYIVKAAGAAWESIVTSAMIFSFGWVWAKLAPKIVSLQNHRTQARFDSALILILGLVKLFLVLYPFVRVAFMQQYDFEPHLCGSSLAETANNIFESTTTCPDAHGIIPWPEGNTPNGRVTLDCKNVEDWFGEYTWERTSEHQTVFNTFVQLVRRGRLHQIEGSGVDANSTNDGFDHVCPYGCFPQKCDARMDGTSQSCLTSCYISLRRSIQTYYVTDIVCTLLFIAIPWFLKWNEARKELLAARDAGNKKSALTQLALQEKKKEIAPYAYYEWGGSYVEDFLQVMLGFALSCCFGMFAPELMIIGFLALSAQYFLLVHRMTRVTSRPYPLGAKGIGAFGNMLEVIAAVSVIVNAAMLVYVMRTPISVWSPLHKALMFSFAWAGCSFARLAVNMLLPQEASDVRNIEDANHRFVRMLKRKIAHEKRGNEEAVSSGDAEPVPLYLPPRASA